MVYQFFGMDKKYGKDLQTLMNLYFNKAKNDITSRYLLGDFFIKKPDNIVIYSKKDFTGNKEYNMFCRQYQLFNFSFIDYLPNFNSQLILLSVNAKNKPVAGANNNPQETKEDDQKNYLTKGLMEQTVIPFTSDEPHLDYLYKTSLLTQNYFNTLIGYEKKRTKEQEKERGQEAVSDLMTSMGPNIEANINENSEVIIPMDITLLDHDVTEGNMCMNPKNGDEVEGNYGYLCYNTKIILPQSTRGGRKTKRNRKKLSKNKNKKPKFHKTRNKRKKYLK